MKQRVKLINGKIPVIGGDTNNKISPYEIDVAFLNDFGSNKNLLDFYKIIFNQYLSTYKQIIGKNVEINSFSAFNKTCVEMFNMITNITYEFEFTTTSADCTFEVGSKCLDFIEYKVDFGDGTIAYTTNENVSHNFADAGKYIITISINKIKDWSKYSFTSMFIIPFFINILNSEQSSCKCIKGSMNFFYQETSTDKDVWYIATTPKGTFNSNLEEGYGMEPDIVYFGDNTLPYFVPIDDITEYESGNTGKIKEVYIQTIGTDFSPFIGEYTALTTLKVAPDDLNTFKTAVTAFNKGNTTATLTVLKGKNQEEAYQWATANGHFASIVKE